MFVGWLDGWPVCYDPTGKTCINYVSEKFLLSAISAFLLISVFLLALFLVIKFIEGRL